jgi:hypothetical protein
MKTIVRRKRKTKSELEADLLRLALRIGRLERVNAVAQMTATAYEPRISDIDITMIGIPPRDECFEVNP